MSFKVYILKLSDGSMYTGYTKDLNNRIKLHAAGRGSKYVKSRLPLQLIFSEDYSNRSEAMRREIQIKKFSRSKKLNLIKNNTIISDTMLDKTLHI
ncbi:MAG: GIY-YIG nuclease family protein [Candidatus Kariarchaeaceae archaeon]